MTSIPLTDLFFIVFVLVDEWYQATGKGLLKGKLGVKPVFTDSEVITLMLMQDFIPYPSETQYIAYLRANYLTLFPKMVDQSQYNRRARALWQLVEELRRFWVLHKGWHEQSCFLLDTKPVPVVGYKRDKHQSDFLGSANYGKCASRKLEYFGYKLVTVTSLSGIPIYYDLVPANTDEQTAAESVIDQFAYCDLPVDIGFISSQWQTQVFDRIGNLIWTPQRSNQKHQNDPRLDRFLSKTRDCIEGVFYEIQDLGRNIERLLAKTVLGLTTRVICKFASHILRRLLWVDFGVKVQTFEVSSAS